MNRNSDHPAGRLDQGLSDMRQMAPSDAEVQEAAARVFHRLEDEHRKVTPFPAERIPQTGAAAIEGCSGFRALIPAYVAGILQPDWSLLLEDHTRQCAGCRRTLEYARVGSPPRLAAAAPASWDSSRRRRLGAVAAVAALVALAAFGTSAVRNLLWPIDVHAMAQTVEGSLYLVSGQDTQAIAAGRRIERGQAVRAGAGSRAVLRMADGSLLEMSPRAELTLADGGNGVNVRLHRGSVVVTTEKGAGPLILETPDCAVSGAGAIFAVSAAPKGSRIAVIDGEARMLQNGVTSILAAGRQISTSASMTPVSLRDELAWSPDASARLELLTALAGFRDDAGQRVAAAGMRFDSDLKGMIPAGAAVVASLPNVSQPLSDAYALFKRRIEESDALRKWWSADQRASSGAGAISDELMSRMSRLGAYLGPEILLAFPASKTESPIVLASVTNPDAAVAVIRNDLARMSNLGPKAGETPFTIIRTPSELEAAARTGNQPVIYIDRNWMAVSSPRQIQQAATFRKNPQLNPFPKSPLGRRIDQAYAGGVGWLLAADLQQMTNRGPLNPNTPEESASGVMKWLGLDDADQLIVEQKTGEAGAGYRATLGFVHPRHGAAAWIGEPSPMGALDFVSPQTYAAAAVVTRDPSLILDDMLQQTAGADMALTLERFQKEHHLDIRNDLAAPLGSEFLVAIDGPLLPTLAWRAVIEVNDAARLQSSIETAVTEANREWATSRPLALSSEMVDGRTFYRLSAGEPPSEIHYAYWGGYLVVGPKRAFVIDAIRARDSGQSLARAPAFRSQLPQGADMVSGLIYSNIQGIAGSSKAGPNTVYLYGEPDRITLSGRGLLGLNGTGATGLARLGELARGKTEK